MIKVGVVGMGKMGLLHSSILSSFENVNYIGFADDNKIMSDTFKKLKPAWIIQNDYKNFVQNHEMDILFITTPISTHYDIIKLCLKNNLSFFVEKPAFSSLEQANSISKCLDNFKGKSMVGYMMRFISTFVKAKELIDNNSLGKIRSFEGTMYISQLFKEGKGWRYDSNLSGGGVVVHQTCHLIDLLNWFFGHPSKVGAITNNWFSSDVEDHAHIIFNYDNNLTGWVDSTWSRFNKRMLSTRLHIEGEYGSLTVDDDSVKLFLTKDRSKNKKGWTSFSKIELGNGVDIDFGAPYYSTQNRSFIDSILDKSSNSNLKFHDIQSSIKLQSILSAIYKSSKNNGELINLGYFDE